MKRLILICFCRLFWFALPFNFGVSQASGYSSVPSLEHLSRIYRPFILMRINYHEDPSKNIQLQPKLAKELVDLGFTFAYKDDILEDHRLESDLFRPNDYLKDGQRYFRIILTGDPLESANMMDIEPSCKIRIEYRVIRKVVAPLGSQTPELYEEVIPMNSLWKEDFADQVPYSCSNEVFLSRVAEGIENFNKEIIGSIRRTIQKQTYDKKINTK